MARSVRDAVGMRFGGNQDRSAFRPSVRAASRLQRLDQHRAVAGKVVELFRIVLARQRPKPRADAAAHDETDDAFRHGVRASVTANMFARVSPTFLQVTEGAPRARWFNVSDVMRVAGEGKSKTPDHFGKLTFYNIYTALALAV